LTQSAVTIRLFRVEDLNQVMDINRKCLPENYESSFFKELHERYPNTFIVAEEDGVIVAYVMCRIELGFPDLKRFGIPKKGHVVSLAVLPDSRRKGIATELMKEAMKAMDGYGCSECYLEVRTTNEPALDLYRKMGFSVGRRIEGYYFDGEAAFFMTRKLPYIERNADT